LPHGVWRLACLLAPVLGCAPEARAPEPVVCAAPHVTGRLSAELAEASGIAPGSGNVAAWAINDGGPPELFALDSTGNVLARVPVRAARKRDWETLAAARCGTGTCLYIGDTGDNLRNRETLRVYRVPEPTLTAGSTAPAEPFEFRFPDGPHDTEALFLLPSERLYVVTKGRSEPITVYHYPGPLRADTVLTLERVQELSPSFVQLPDMVTGAGATADGQWIVLRTYAYVQLFRFRNGRLEPALPSTGLNLQALQEFQGEGADIQTDGTILLLSEKGLDDNNAPISRLACTLP
jgi:hypothetical protein